MIAQKHFISVDTVRSYIRSVYEKLEVHSRSEAIVRALNDTNLPRTVKTRDQEPRRMTALLLAARGREIHSSYTMVNDLQNDRLGTFSISTNTLKQITEIGWFFRGPKFPVLFANRCVFYERLNQLSTDFRHSAEN